MPEAGGPATQSGIFYQNSVAALALADLLDLDPKVARERAVEVRVEAPQDVDDITIRFADGHSDSQSVKLAIRDKGSKWSIMWRRVAAQAAQLDPDDQITLVVGEKSSLSQDVAELCERAASSVDAAELSQRLTVSQTSAFDSIAENLGSSATAFELLERTTLRHRALGDIEEELSRRRLAGGQSPPPALLPILRDMVGGQARRRGLFRPGPLRRRLQLEHGILLGEPPEWGLRTYREMIKQLSRIEVPGMGVSGAAEDLFVWPRAREHDRSRQTGFEDEEPGLNQSAHDASLDLQAFPNDRLDRVVVVAGPGYGKSALLTAISGELAEGPLAPISISLASLASTDSSVLSFLSNSISQEFDLSADWQLLADQGLLVLLLDGLDEVPANARPGLMQRIATFSARYPRTPWMLTVRDPAVVKGLPEAIVVELLPLDDEDIERFAHAMRTCLGDVDPWQFVRRIRLSPDLNRLARIPLFLAMLLANLDPETPAQLTRSDLIEAYLKTLFSPSEHKQFLHAPVDRSTTLRTMAQTLAFERLEQQEIGATELEVREVVGRQASEPSHVTELFEQLKGNGILKPQSPFRLQFPYPIVQEYLAACHLIAHYPDSLQKRFDDAMQRPWAQVIQFALERHPEPEPIIRAMLEREDDAFSTGLRLIGRCIANGAKVSPQLRAQVGDRLVAFWVHAPSRSRELAGRLIADGFSDSPSHALTEALHHHWLIYDGAGDIISRLRDRNLTLSVLRSLIARRDSIMIYHSLKPAIGAAGDAAFRLIVDELMRAPDEDRAISISSLMVNFPPRTVARELALSVAHDSRFPNQVRMRAHSVAGAPLDDDGVSLTLTGLRHEDWDNHYEARSLVQVHGDPPRFLAKLLRDSSIPLDRRTDLAACVAETIPDAIHRRRFIQTCVSDSSIAEEIRLTLQLIDARFGDRNTFHQLVCQLDHMPAEYASTTIALFGHYPDRELGERAATLIRDRDLTPQQVVRIANSVSTGMLHVFEMDFGLGGTLRPAPPHPATAAWTELLEEWARRDDLSPLNRLTVLTAGSELGSERARADLEALVFAIEDIDGSDWIENGPYAHELSHALREIRRRTPLLRPDFVEKVASSTRYNVAKEGIGALQAQGDADALKRLLDLHASEPEWSLRDLIANAIELTAARLGAVIQKKGREYELADSKALA